MKYQDNEDHKHRRSEYHGENHQAFIKGILDSELANGLPALALADPTNLAELATKLRLADPEGRLLPIPMKAIHIESGGINSLPTIITALASGSRVLLVTDPVNIPCKNESLKDKIYQLLKDHYPINWLILSEKNGNDLHASREHAETIIKALPDIDCVVGVGGGTIADLCKYALHSSGSAAPLVLVQTMLSVNAFSDGLSVMLLNGVKRTVQSRYPSALIIDMDVVRQAPVDRNLSGYGDLMATWTAPVDWLLANALGMCSAYHGAPYQFLRHQSLELLFYSDDLRAKTENSYTRLAKVLTLSGFAMGLAGESSPASGSEHTISHLLDMAAESHGQTLAHHGAQVGVSALFMTCVWDEFLHGFDPSSVDFDACFPDEAFMESHNQYVFQGLDDTGKLEQECWQDYRKKLTLWHANRENTHQVLKNWSEVKLQFQSMVLPPEPLVECMRQAGAPIRFSGLLPSIPKERAFWAIKNCHLYRSRFTLVDFLFFTGIWNDAFIWRILTKLERMGAGL